jgi:hypothetical protein
MPLNLVLFLGLCVFILGALYLEPLKKLVTVLVVLAMVFVAGWYWATRTFPSPSGLGSGVVTVSSQ